MVQVLVPDAEADALFEYVCQNTRIDNRGGGIAMMTRTVHATSYRLPTE